MAIVGCLLLGAIVGWIGSLAMRSPTTEDILVDIGVGLAGAFALASVIASSSTFDNIVAGYLGSVSAVAILYVVRRVRRNRRRMREHSN